MEMHVDKVIENSKAIGLRKQFAQKTQGFRRDERGSLLIFSLFILILMLMVAGMAVDLMRAETLRARLQGTLDRAVLAGASLDQALDSKEVVIDYFAKAGLSEYLDEDSVIVTNGDNLRSVSASAQMNIDTFFMNMVGIDTLQAPASGSAEESVSNIEISLVLDVSGSMSRNIRRYNWWEPRVSKISLLRTAAQDFVYQVQCNPQTIIDDDGNSSIVCAVDDNTVSVSLVPYAEQVLVGEELLNWYNVTTEHNESWCADFEDADFDFSSGSDSTGISTSAVLQRTGRHDARSNWGSNASESYRTCRTDSWREIVPLSNSYSDLQTAIGNLHAGGYTSIDLGLKWGLAMLDPVLRPDVASVAGQATLPYITGEFFDRPFNYGSAGMQKVIVLMTDGVNTTQYKLKDSHKDGPSEFFYNDDDANAQDVLSVYDAVNDRYYYHSSDNTFDYDNTVHTEPFGDTEPDYSITYPSSWNWQGYVTGWSTKTISPNGTSNQMTYPQVWERYSVNYYKNLHYFLQNPVTIMNNGEKNTRLLALCEEAKQPNGEDVIIFTIGFETDANSDLVMSQCASTTEHYFDADGTDLNSAFAQIVRKIHELRLIN